MKNGWCTISLLAALAGCSGSGEPLSADAGNGADGGGHPADVGADGMGLTDTAGQDGGTGPADGLASDCPPCLVGLLDRCPLAGTCIDQEQGGKGNKCYSNGAKVCSDATRQPMGVISGRFFGADGQLCLTIEGTFDPSLDGPRPVTYVIRDGSGAVIATYIIPPDDVPVDTIDVTCHDDGKVYPMARNNQCGHQDIADECTTGSCECPA
jgi:hypothetical protein